jgi:hypothetical protein
MTSDPRQGTRLEIQQRAHGIVEFRAVDRLPRSDPASLCLQSLRAVVALHLNPGF